MAPTWAGPGLLFLRRQLCSRTPSALNEGAKRSGLASMLLLGEGSEATEPYNKYANLFKGPYLVMSFQAGCISFVGITLSQEYQTPHTVQNSLEKNFF